MLTIKRQGDKVLDYSGGDEIGWDDIIDVESSIWVAAARSEAITMENVDRLETK